MCSAFAELQLDEVLQCPKEDVEIELQGSSDKQEFKLNVSVLVSVRSEVGSTIEAKIDQVLRCTHFCNLLIRDFRHFFLLC